MMEKVQIFWEPRRGPLSNPRKCGGDQGRLPGGGGRRKFTNMGSLGGGGEESYKLSTIPIINFVF